MKNLLGGKGANLAEMSEPRACPFRQDSPITHGGLRGYFYDQGQAAIPTDLDVGRSRPRWATIGRLASAARFGDDSNPLLVSVRSGARASMPGMMDTVLNLGLNDRHGARPSAASLRRSSASRGIQLPPFHPDVFQRGARTSTTISVRGHPRRGTRNGKGLTCSTPISKAADWKPMFASYKEKGRSWRAAEPFPQDPHEPSSGVPSAPCSPPG